jgi:hypothetical protein
MFIVQAYQTSQHVVPRGGKWRSSFAGSSDGKMNVQSACALNTRYLNIADCVVSFETGSSMGKDMDPFDRACVICKLHEVDTLCSCELSQARSQLRQSVVTVMNLRVKNAWHLLNSFSRNILYRVGWLDG